MTTGYLKKQKTGYEVMKKAVNQLILFLKITFLRYPLIKKKIFYEIFKLNF
jgi:hypothetical protein